MVRCEAAANGPETPLNLLKGVMHPPLGWLSCRCARIAVIHRAGLASQQKHPSESNGGGEVNRGIIGLIIGILVIIILVIVILQLT